MSLTLILGDIHIGKSVSMGKQIAGSGLNSRIVDQINILDWFYNLAIDMCATNLILTGDIFEDPKPHPTIITLFVSWLKKCSDSGLIVRIITGNHDVLRSGQFYMSALDIIVAADIENVKVYNKMSTFHTPGASFTLIPFRDRKSFNLESNSKAIDIIDKRLQYENAECMLSNMKVCVGHMAIEGSIFVGDEIDDMGNELFCPIKMFNKYDYTFMGHVHKYQILSKSPYVSHIGSMDLSDFGESNHNKFVIAFDSQAENPIKEIEIPTRKLNSISIPVPSNIKDATEFVVKELKEKHNNLSKSIVKVNVNLPNSDILPIDRRIIESTLNDLGAFHIYKLSEDRKISPIKKDKSTNIDNTVNESVAIKMFADSQVDENIRDNFIATANDLIKQYKENEK